MSIYNKNPFKNLSFNLLQFTVTNYGTVIKNITTHDKRGCRLPVNKKMKFLFIICLCQPL